MFGYPAVWKTNFSFDSAALLNEFLGRTSKKLSKVYDLNSDWTGVTVYDGQGIDELNNLPMLSSVLNQIGRSSIVGVTYFNLAANSFLHSHRDMNGNLLFGILRLHIPLQTNTHAIMEVEGKSYHMPENTAWILDTSGLHGLKNYGDAPRIHLVVDVKKSPETNNLFPKISASLFFHMLFFSFVVFYKLIRGVIFRPASLIPRVKRLLVLLEWKKS